MAAVTLVSAPATFDVATTVAAIVADIREVTGGRPVVVAFSGGLDSSTVAALAREALGAANVLLVTVNMGAYAYRRGNEIVVEMAAQLGLRQKCLLGQTMQHRVQRHGPACNQCTRKIKLGMVKRAAVGRLVLTGSNRSDTWGQMGVKVCDGYYAPLLDLDKPQIRALADHLGLQVPRIGESSGREGCKLKHLLKPLVNPDYHGAAVAAANEVVLRALGEAGLRPHLANVKVAGPLGRNVGLVNVWPMPAPDVCARLRAALAALPFLDEVHVVGGPLRLTVLAGSALMNDPRARHWIHHGRLQPDFAFPLEVDWRAARNPRLHTFQVVAYQPVPAPENSA